MQPLPSDPVLSVVVIEDDAFLRETLCKAIAAQPGMRVAAAFGAVGPAIEWLAGHAPDVLLTDLGLPDGSGIDAIRACVRQHPDCDILVISLFGDETNVLAAIDAGAMGYILKDAEDLDVARFIADLRQGGSPMSPMVARKLLTRVQQPPRGMPPPARSTGPDTVAVAASGLTARELEALDLIARGYTYREIAALLALSVGTVQTHIKHIYAKLSVHTRGEAVFEAHKLGILQSGLLAPDRD
ncbi:response regulator [Variovorax sp. VNK109]|jgi:DNA-binding NarL/FixJ family response regulator|uniref:response regulator n=1 Tax=Variovorax sp. VNK109 TaxID=3400919 RepID=UPI003C1000DE